MRFPAATVRKIASIKYFYIRAGGEHDFLPVWVVVVDGRVLVRSWNDKPSGWYRAFLKERRGSVRIGSTEVRVAARKVSGTRLLDAMDEAYAAKYVTRANAPYVRGFRSARRRAHTLELLPV